MTTTASVSPDDFEFVRRVEQCEFAASAFGHADHARLARICLHQMPFDDARVRQQYLPPDKEPF